MKHLSAFGAILLAASLLGACGTERAVYTSESFASDSPFKLKIDGEIKTACESARRSLLGQGYRIESATSEQVQGRKAYRSSGNQNTFIEMNIVCVADNVGSTLFANGVLSTYDLKKSSSAASVGLSALGSISLPIGQSADSLVKIAEETISDKDFYARFFAAVGFTLGEMRGPKPAEPAALDAVEPTPAIPLETGPVLTTTRTPVSGEPVSASPSQPVETAAEPVAMPVEVPVRPAPPMAPGNVTIVTTPATPAANTESPRNAVVQTTMSATPAANAAPATATAPVTTPTPIESDPPAPATASEAPMGSPAAATDAPATALAPAMETSIAH